MGEDGSAAAEARDSAHVYRTGPGSTLRFLTNHEDGVAEMVEEFGARGEGTPMHRHDWPHWSLVVDGAVRFVIEGRQDVVAGAGDLVHVPAGVEHGAVTESERSHMVELVPSGGRFRGLLDAVLPLMAAEGGPDMAAVAERAAEFDTVFTGPAPRAGGA